MYHVSMIMQGRVQADGKVGAVQAAMIGARFGIAVHGSGVQRLDSIASGQIIMVPGFQI